MDPQVQGPQSDYLTEKSHVHYSVVILGYFHSARFIGVYTATFASVDTFSIVIFCEH